MTRGTSCVLSPSPPLLSYPLLSLASRPIALPIALEGTTPIYHHPSSWACRWGWLSAKEWQKVPRDAEKNGGEPGDREEDGDAGMGAT
eukprot:748983-Hanusia_phi.AAC.1